MLNEVAGVEEAVRCSAMAMTVSRVALCSATALPEAERATFTRLNDFSTARPVVSYCTEMVKVSISAVMLSRMVRSARSVSAK